jgi:hypothetical protein
VCAWRLSGLYFGMADLEGTVPAYRVLSWARFAAGRLIRNLAPRTSESSRQPRHLHQPRSRQRSRHQPCAGLDAYRCGDSASPGVDSTISAAAIAIRMDSSILSGSTIPSVCNLRFFQACARRPASFAAKLRVFVCGRSYGYLQAIGDPQQRKTSGRALPEASEV